MAQRALPPGAVRRRTAFGLFDSDGWTWASLKATFWFVVAIFLLGYLPDRLYYFTVLPTVDIGYNVISPVNLCSAENGQLPCPAPAGAIVPWQPSPAELDLPQARSDAAAFSLAERLYVLGGRTADGVTDSALATAMEEATLERWTEGPALPAPRADAVAVVASGVPYLIGGVDADGNATTTVLRATLEEGALSGWEEFVELELPVAVTDASAVASIRGIYLFGGRVDGQLSNTVWLAEFDEADTPQLQPWVELTELPLPEARADASAVLESTFIYVLGGEGPEGVSNSVFFLHLDIDGHPVIDAGSGRAQGWGVSVGQAERYALPEPRTRHASFRNAGAIYVIGGEDPDGVPQATTFWAVPDITDGTIPLWRQLDVTELPEGRAGSASVAIAGQALVFGGETDAGPSATVLRADMSPALPFFRLGLFGLTVPGLAIPGEIGQELGLINATGAGATMFLVLVIIGIAYAHPRGTMRFIERISRGRFRAPLEEEPRA